MGKTSEALERFNQLLKEHPDSSVVRLNRAGLLASVGKTTEAEEDYRALLNKSPRDRNVRIALHELLQQQHRFEELPEIWLEKDKTLPLLELDFPGWLAFAFTLVDGTSTEARMYARQIKAGSTGRVLADWAIVYRDLAEREFDRWPADLRADSFASIPKLMRQEQGRVVVVALADLPEEIRNTPSATCALVAALAFKADLDTARAALEQLRKMPDSAAWVERAQAYLDAAERID